MTDATYKRPINEENYAEIMQSVVEPFVKKYRKEGFLKFNDGRQLHYEYYIKDNAKANIVIAHGYTEMLLKYREMIYYFLNEGYNVFAVEHMGHGLSSRLTDNPNLAHIESFDMYVNDFASFVNNLVKPKSNGLPLYLYAHSMGGAISVLHLQRYPGVFEKAVLSAPMLAPKTAGFPHFATKLMTRAFILMGKGGEMVFTEHEFNPDRTYLQSGDTSEARFNYVHAKRKLRQEYRTCATTYRWLNEALRIIKIMLKPESCKKITAKVLLFQAENDTLVEPLHQEKFISMVNNGEIVKTSGTKHELYLSINETLEPYLDRIFDFLSE
ncbi:MAG: alpha/beta hydrolase [Clostridia bacterium]|nr:alpha/beta hydrolase [Clostridia bacterium]